MEPPPEVVTIRDTRNHITVEIALIKGVTIVLSCRAGKIPYKQICFLTSFEPNKVYLGPNRNNTGVTIIFFPARNFPILLDFLLLVLLVLRAALPSPTATPDIYYCDPPPFHKPESQNKI